MRALVRTVTLTVAVVMRGAIAIAIATVMRGLVDAGDDGGGGGAATAHQHRPDGGERQCCDAEAETTTWAGHVGARL